MQGQPFHAAAGVREGDVIADKYRVERVLGQGGMGVVVAAHHMQLDQKVAIKFLLPEALQNAEAVGRFAREARAAVRILNEHVARVIDVGTLENGAPYMVMEYLEGGDLATWLAQRGPLPIEQAVEFTLQACVAVADAHALGIVHRDLKPANLFCVRRSDGQLSIKVLDFGISKVAALAGTQPNPSLTKTSATMGSPLYMSPEQMQSSKTVDGRTDIWALGIVLFELLAGRPPFMAEGLPDLVLQIATQPAPSLRTFRADVPVGLENVILTCLEKDSARRFGHIGEFALALLPFGPARAKGSVERISGIVQSAGQAASGFAIPGSSLAGGTQVASGTLQALGRTTEAAPQRRSPALIMGVIAMLAAAGTAAFFVAHRAEPASHEPGFAEAAAASPAVETTGPATAIANVALTPIPPSPAAPPPSTTPIATAPPTFPSTPIATAAPTVTSVLGPKPIAPSRPVLSPTAAGRRADCSVPFTIDSLGHRVPKPECL